MDGLSYDGVKYRTEGRVAYITLSRPARLNAIDALMPAAIHRAVDLANADPAGMPGRVVAARCKGQRAMLTLARQCT